MPEGLLATHIVAKRLDLKARMVRYLYQKGQLKGKKIKQRLFFTEEAVKECKAARERKRWDRGHDPVEAKRRVMK